MSNLSPSISVTETDKTIGLVYQDSTTGATAGLFEWGAVNKPTRILNETMLKTIYGKPTIKNNQHWFSALNFLSYSGNLMLCRAGSEELLSNSYNLEIIKKQETKKKATKKSKAVTRSMTLYPLTSEEIDVFVYGLASVISNDNYSFNSIKNLDEIKSFILTNKTLLEKNKKIDVTTLNNKIEELKNDDGFTNYLNIVSASLLSPITKETEDVYIKILMNFFNVTDNQEDISKITQFITLVLDSTTKYETWEKANVKNDAFVGDDSEPSLDCTILTKIYNEFKKLCSELNDGITTLVTESEESGIKSNNEATINLLMLLMPCKRNSKHLAILGRQSLVFASDRESTLQREEYFFLYNLKNELARLEKNGILHLIQHLGNNSQLQEIRNHLLETKESEVPTDPEVPSETETPTNKDKKVYCADGSAEDIKIIDTDIKIISKYPGTLANGLVVSFADASNFDTWEYKNLFNGKPGTSQYSLDNNVENDEIHAVVVDKLGKFGSTNTVLEIYQYLSKSLNGKTVDGVNSYYLQKINMDSNYVIIVNDLEENGDNKSFGKTFEEFREENDYKEGLKFNDLVTNDKGQVTFTLVGGKTYDYSQTEKLETALSNAFDVFRDTVRYDVSLIFAGATSATVSDLVGNISVVRKNSVSFISPCDVDNAGQPVKTLEKVLEFRKRISPNSYTFMDTGYKKVKDKYNNVFVWIPLNSDIAGLCARADKEFSAWISPAGYKRGVLNNVIELAYNPVDTDRDELYKVGINSVISETSGITLLYGDKTLYPRPSALDRINVRRLLIVIQKSIAESAKSQLFEINNEYTRNSFINTVTPLLRRIKNSDGLYDYRVVCDESNNTPDVIDANEFVGDVYIKPAKSINFIKLNSVIINTGSNFEEITNAE